MPQMAPMSWILLFLFFSAMLLTINIMNYYILMPSMKSFNKVENLNVKSNNWKW
uniref:ATP synthase complex subunit 8 n=1 Tax=Orthetrum sabina TaxID=320892 RepID=A0A4Y5SEP0_9ODON|nr:ATP synthase F0 subunit 8 [Orthetrum sabina]